MHTFSHNLKSLRTSANLSQLQVADSVSIKVKTYQAWERRNVEPPIDKLIELARFYNITVDELINTKCKAVELSIESKILAAPEYIKNAIYALLDY